MISTTVYGACRNHEFLDIANIFQGRYGRHQQYAIQTRRFWRGTENGATYHAGSEQLKRSWVETSREILKYMRQIFLLNTSLSAMYIPAALFLYLDWCISYSSHFS